MEETNLCKVIFYTLGLARTVFLPARVVQDRTRVLDCHPFEDDEVDCYIQAETRFSPLAWVG